MKIGNYEIYKNKCIGKGSFSKVYQGEEIEKKYKVAIKEIIVNKLSERIKAQLYEEVEIMKKIMENPHPNIIKCYDVLMVNENLYIIMEFCDCGDLGSLLKRPIKEVYVQYWMCQLRTGLEHLHNLNIVHRDIKPKNILLTNKKRILKIADFGFAKILGPSMRINTLCGSPLYMAPEILYRKASTTKTDLWSIGMIIYEMLFNSHPFRECKDVHELVETMKKFNVIIPPPHNANNNISNDCHKLLVKLLNKDVNNRISWNSFFDDPWVNRFKVKINNNNETQQEISLSFKSIVNPLEKVMAERDQQKLEGIEGVSSNGYEEDSNILEHSHYCIFDIDGSKSSNPSFNIIGDEYFS